MDTDDLEPIKRTIPVRDLTPLSIDALGEYIAEMEAEIERVKLMIEDKRSAREGAESFFKS